VRFVVDAQLPPALARMLAAAGHQAEHVLDVGLRDAEDIAIWQYALEHQAVIVTKDEDFVVRSLRSGPAPVVVWVRIGNASRGALAEWFVPLLAEIVNLVERGERLIEIR
jgi:predicted nuclease of predicted toxin-antitoxin system